MATVEEKSHTNGQKRELNEDYNSRQTPSIRPAKKAKLLDNTDDEDSDAEHYATQLNINAEYARRFEHNKKREEQHRLEEKYGKGKTPQNDHDEDDDEDSEEGVEEDDAAELLDEALDDQVNATLQALRSKDPRIYDTEATFYSAIEKTDQGISGKQGGHSMTLRQYHTKNLLEGELVLDNADDALPKTYTQEQEEARQNLLKELRGAQSEDDDDFLVTKSKPAISKKDRAKITAEDVENADRDPETFLSNFMASRAWIPTNAIRYQPLESDDDEEEAAADEWENSYNMYFEDAQGANEKIMTYARDAVASTTVRRDHATGRRKARDAARAKRETERKQKEQDLARLRKLKIDEMEHKVKQIREVGGLNDSEFKMDEWKDMLEADWSDDQWDAEMQKRFGDAYYNVSDAGSENQDNEDRQSQKPKKPKFDHDINIKDLVSTFDDNEEEKRDFALSSDEENEEESANNNYEEEGEEDKDETATAKSSKKRKQERAEAKSVTRRNRRLIERLVDENLELEASLVSKPKASAQFRYRETSPTAFGLTARDILFADDKQLNEFVGLKKLAAFRDPIKKSKDKKRLSKKARLRQWRLETFGDADGPKGGFETILGGAAGHEPGSTEAVSNMVEGEGKRKKKRNRKRAVGTAKA